MPKRGRKRKTKRSRSSKEELGFIFDAKLKPETARTILVVVLVVIAFLSLLSLMGLAGKLGGAVTTALIQIFGWTSYAIPFVIAGLAAAIYREGKVEEFEVKTSNYVGLLLFVASGAGLLHLSRPFEKSLEAVSQGAGGGYIGFALAYPLEALTGFWATLIILVALFIVGGVMALNTSLPAIAAGLKSFFAFTAALLQRVSHKLFPQEKGVDNLTIHAPEGSSEDTDNESEDERLEEQEETSKAKPELIVTKLSDAEDEPGETPHRKPRSAYQPFPLDLLDGRQGKPTSGDIKANARTIQQTLKNFGIEVELQEVNVGPTVTQYTLRPSEGVKLSQITTLQNDIALALAAHPIRIEAPIPGRSLVGIEIPNQAVALVRLREIFESAEFSKRKSNLALALGRNVAGVPITADLAKMPHLLIAGATGAGKSVCINDVILSLIYQNHPDDLKLILVDPKKVELTIYNGMPHLLTPVITEVDKTINAMRWTVAEMDRRFRLLSEHKERNIVSYNANHPDDKLPYIVLIIDELADLMAVAANEIEAAVVRLAQMARAVGIHLILSTQRPSVDIITGLIKANITSRIAFTVASQIDSRTILDMSGAEKLLGNGDMLYVTHDLGKPKRIQGAFVTDNEIKRVIEFLRKDEPDYRADVTEKQVSATPGLETSGGVMEDPFFADAKRVVEQAGKASASLLQRRLRVGYARAARLLDILEEAGIVGPADGAKPRDVMTSSQPAMPNGEDNTYTDETEDTKEEPEEEKNDSEV